MLSTRAGRLKRAAVAATVATTLVALAACSPAKGGSEGSSTAAAVGQSTGDVVRGGTLVVGDTNNKWTTLDPHVTNTNVGPYKTMYEPLFHYGPKDGGASEIQPALATAWSLKDPIHPTITIRQGVTFHDGSKLTPEVVAWNVERMVKDKDSNQKATLTDIKSVKVLDDTKVQLTLTGPSPSIFIRLSDSAGVGTGIVSEDAYTKNGADWFAMHEAGTGPFQLKSFTQDQDTQVVAYKGYWDKGTDGKPLPYLDGIDYQMLRDTGAAVSGLKAGTIDVVGDPDSSMLKSVASTSSIEVLKLTSQNGYPGTFGFNYKKAPFNDKLVRQAAQTAMDRATISKVVNPEYSEPAEVPLWNDSMPGWDASLDHAYDFDVDKAKSLMAQAGVKSPVKATLIYQSREPDATIAQLWKQQFAKIGIELKTVPLEETVFEQRLVSGDFDMATWGWGTPLTPDFASVYWGPGGAQNWVDYDNPAVTKPMDEAAKTVDTAKQAALYKEMLTQLMNDATYGVIVRQKSLTLQRTVVQGTQEYWGFLDFDHAYKTGK